MKELLIICDESQNHLFGQAFSIVLRDNVKISFVNDEKGLSEIADVRNMDQRVIAVDVGLQWDGKSVSNRGFDLACELRLNCLVTSKIVLMSSLREIEFHNLKNLEPKFGLLEAEGTEFLQIPIAEDRGAALLDWATARISEKDLDHIVAHFCDPLLAFRKMLHNLANFVSEPEDRNPQILALLDKWQRPIGRYWPELFESYTRLRKELIDSPGALPADRLKAIEEFDSQSLKLTDQEDDMHPTDERLELLPMYPPKGFSRIMVADDTPVVYLANALRADYLYDIIRPQATKLRQAIKIHDEQQPDVILADLYFKESDRTSESPDKQVGYKFINYVLKARGDSRKPLILITSKALLRIDTEVPVGVINCSGALRATDPAAIHGEIWKAALKLGITGPEEIAGRSWGIEHSSRKRLENAARDLPMLIEQWSEFGILVRDTLTLCRLLRNVAFEKDLDILVRLIDLLESHESITDFSLSHVNKIFTETTTIHMLVKEPPESLVKNSIRNILHGKIEQFSSITGAVRAIRKTTMEVSKDLSAHGFESAGNNLVRALSRFSEDTPLQPDLVYLKNSLDAVIGKLPAPPEQHPIDVPVGQQKKKIKIIVVEDTPYWSNFVLRTLERVEKVLGPDYTFERHIFDNVADTLAAVPEKSARFAPLENDSLPTIAIVDICLPKDKAEAETIHSLSRSGTDTFVSPTPTNGLTMIEALSSYNRNIPLIIFSTIDSIENRRKICGWGVPEQNFVSKRYGAERELERALVRFVEKSYKYFVKRYENWVNDKVISLYWINGVEVKFSAELNETFSAIYELAQSGSEIGFTIDQIISQRGDANDDFSRHKIHDHISEIRRRIFNTLRKARIYVDPRDFIKIETRDDLEQSLYRLNAEVMSIEDEEDYEEDLLNLSYNNRILLVEEDEEARAAAASTLINFGYIVEAVEKGELALKRAAEFQPDVVSLGLNEQANTVNLWKRIKNELSHKDLGVILTFTGKIDNEWAHAAVLAGVPLGNLLLKNALDWVSFYLYIVSREQRRIFLGETASEAVGPTMPVVEILAESNFQTGRLSLLVNGRPYASRSSQLARILGYLLENPRKLLSYETVKASVVGEQPVTVDDRRNWPQRIRNIVKTEWLNSGSDADRDKFSKETLESSERGLRLNIQLIDRRKIS